MANLGCGFDVMGLTLDGVGDLLEVGVEPGAEGLSIRNDSDVDLPASLDDNVITPAVRAMLEAYGRPVRVEIRLLEKIVPEAASGRVRPRRLRLSTASTNCWAAPSRANGSWSSPCRARRCSAVRLTPIMSVRRCWAAWC